MEEEFQVKLLEAMSNMAKNMKALREDTVIRMSRAEARIRELIVRTEKLQEELDKVKEQVKLTIN